MIVSGVIQQLESSSELTALLAYHPLVSGKHAIYAKSIPQQSTHPLIVVSATDEDIEYVLRGDAGLTEAIVDLEVQTVGPQGYGRLEAILEQIRQALTPTGGTFGAVEIQGVQLSRLRDEDFKAPEKSDDTLFVGGWDATIWFERSAILT